MKKKKTNRGFEILEFEDSYGVKCTLQESSNVVPNIWLGADKVKVQEPNPDGPGWREVKLPPVHVANNRMHLSRKTVWQLLPHLLKFAITGRL